jgi:hypothetical protein
VRQKEQAEGNRRPRNRPRRTERGGRDVNSGGIPAFGWSIRFIDDLDEQLAQFSGYDTAVDRTSPSGIRCEMAVARLQSADEDVGVPGHEVSWFQ